MLSILRPADCHCSWKSLTEYGFLNSFTICFSPLLKNKLHVHIFHQEMIWIPYAFIFDIRKLKPQKALKNANLEPRLKIILHFNDWIGQYYIFCLATLKLMNNLVSSKEIKFEYVNDNVIWTVSLFNKE